MATECNKSKAIVLAAIPINDHTQFVHLYTQECGRVTCRVPMATRGKRASTLRSTLTPLTVLEVILCGRQRDEIRSISEAQVLLSPYMMTFGHPDKASQCLYMAELIDHTVREVEANPRLWDFMVGAIDTLAQCQEGWANFHLIFTCGLIKQLGFGIDTKDYAEGCQFDLREGRFTTSPIMHPYYFNAASAAWFCRVFDTDYDHMDDLALSRSERASLLDMLLSFLALQIPEMGQLRSLEVLKTLFD